MINPFLSGLAQAGADATQNIATGMAKSQELQRQQLEKAQEEKARLANIYISRGMIRAAAPILKELYPEMTDQHIDSWQAEEDQKKSFTKLGQAKSLMDMAGNDPAKARSLGESIGFKPESFEKANTAQVPVTETTEQGRQFSPIKADGSPILAPLTTTKTMDAYDYITPKSEPIKLANGVLLTKNAAGKYEVAFEPKAKEPAQRLVQSYNGDGTATLVPATPGQTIRQKPAAVRGGGHGGVVRRDAVKGSKQVRVTHADGSVTLEEVRPGMVVSPAKGDKPNAGKTMSDKEIWSTVNSEFNPVEPYVNVMSSKLDKAKHEAWEKARQNRFAEIKKQNRASGVSETKSYNQYLKK